MRELTTSLASNLNVDKEVEAVEDIPNRQEPNPSRSKQWINTIGSEGPASPAERLSQSARLDSGEFITPFLTMAAFVYFLLCFVYLDSPNESQSITKKTNPSIKKRRP